MFGLFLAELLSFFSLAKKCRKLINTYAASSLPQWQAIYVIDSIDNSIVFETVQLAVYSYQIMFDEIIGKTKWWACCLLESF